MFVWFGRKALHTNIIYVLLKHFPCRMYECVIVSCAEPADVARVDGQTLSFTHCQQIFSSLVLFFCFFVAHVSFFSINSAFVGIPFGATVASFTLSESVWPFLFWKFKCFRAWHGKNVEWLNVNWKNMTRWLVRTGCYRRQLLIKKHKLTNNDWRRRN